MNDFLYIIFNSEYMKNIPLELIQAFMVFAQSKNMVKAAESLGVSQPTLTRHLQEFENHFSEKIFIDRGRNKELSSLGHVVFTRLESNWVNYQSLILEAVSTHLEKPIAPISLIGPFEWLNRMTPSVGLDYPIRCVPCLSEEVEERVRSMEGFAVGLTRVMNSKSELIAQKAFESHLQILFPEKWKIKSKKFSDALLTELADHPRFAFREDTTNSPFFEKMKTHRIQTQITIPSWMVLIDLVHQGKGWVVAPSDVVAQYAPKGLGSVEIPESFIPKTKYDLIYKAEHRRIPWFKKFIDRTLEHS